MKTTRYIAALAVCMLAMSCAREQLTPGDWTREAAEGMSFGLDLTSTKSVFVNNESPRLQWVGDETITVLSCPAAMLDIWDNSDVQGGDFSKIHFGNFTVTVDDQNPSKATVFTRDARYNWVGGESGNDSDLYAFMAWTPAFDLNAAQGDENGFYTECEVPESQPDALYSKYQILYDSDLHLPTADEPNNHIFTRNEILEGTRPVEFGQFVPATSMIRFRMRLKEGENLSATAVSKIVIQSESGAPLTGKAGLQPDHEGEVHAWSHFYPTQTDQNTSDVIMEFTEPITVGEAFGNWLHAVVIPCKASGKITFICYDTQGKEVLYAEKPVPVNGFEPGVRHTVELEMTEPPVYFFYVPSGDVVIPAEGGNITTTVASYKLDRATGERTTLGFRYEGAYADEACTFKVSTLTNSRIRYYIGHQVNGDDQQITITPKGNGIVDVLVPYETNNAQIVLASDYMGVTAALRTTPEVGSESAPVNLAAETPGSSDPAVYNTANTYVVNGPGWYSIPLVYGNAIKEGASNTAAYGPYSAATGITAPYISGASKAYVIWTDAYIPFNEDVTREECLTYGTEGYRSIETDLSLSIKGNKLIFHLPQDGIDQGNLVVGVKDASGNTLWSWQIWVTDYKMGTDDMPVLNTEDSAAPYYFMQRALGSTVPAVAKVTSIDGRLYSRWIQLDENGQDSDRIFVFKITQRGHTAPIYRRYSKSGTSYQWGRKDPRYVYCFADEKTFAPKLIHGVASFGFSGCGYDYFTDDDYPQSMELTYGAGYGTIAEGIRAPYKWFYAEGNPVWYSDALTYQPWNADVKTIFDPSPVGYRIPTARELAYFTDSNNAAVQSLSDVVIDDYTYNEYLTTVKTGIGSATGTISGEVESYIGTTYVGGSTYHAFWVAGGAGSPQYANYYSDGSHINLYNSSNNQMYSVLPVREVSSDIAGANSAGSYNVNPW